VQSSQNQAAFISVYSWISGGSSRFAGFRRTPSRIASLQKTASFSGLGCPDSPWGFAPGAHSPRLPDEPRFLDPGSAPVRPLLNPSQHSLLVSSSLHLPRVTNPRSPLLVCITLTPRNQLADSFRRPRSNQSFSDSPHLARVRSSFSTDPPPSPPVTIHHSSFIRSVQLEIQLIPKPFPPSTASFAQD